MTDRVVKPRSEIGSVDAFLGRCDALLAENARERVLDTTVRPQEVSNTSGAVMPRTWADVHRAKP